MNNKVRVDKNAICLHSLPYVLNICIKFEFLISQGSVAICLSWGGQCGISFVANFMHFPAVQKFWQSVKILQSYRYFKDGNFFETQCSSRRSSLITFKFSTTKICSWTNHNNIRVREITVNAKNQLSISVTTVTLAKFSWKTPERSITFFYSKTCHRDLRLVDNKCSKWCPFTWIQVRSRFLHLSMTSSMIAWLKCDHTDAVSAHHRLVCAFGTPGLEDSPNFFIY